ncbi:unnamed protein product [Gongylonema pulchrum]|uniref:Cilia- and flagella-associated protein 157 n=1 Tax=Gongylonema pulchrum TaxID=637853 RepID=A0A183D262_9BILA|nr:unnamed protein product [Gongylonema pulchrum]
MKARHSDEIALIRKQLADKERLVLQYTDRLVAAEAKDSEIALLQETLAVEKKKYRLFEQTVCSQMSSSAQEKAFLQRKCEQELASTEKRCSQVEMERNQNLQSLQQYKNESQNRNRKMDHLMKSNALLEKRVKEIETTAVCCSFLQICSSDGCKALLLIAQLTGVAGNITRTVGLAGTKSYVTLSDLIAKDCLPSGFFLYLDLQCSDRLSVANLKQ